MTSCCRWSKQGFRLPNALCSAARPRLDRQSLFDTNTANPSPLQAPADAHEHSLAHYRTMRNAFANRHQTVSPLLLRSGHRLEPPQNVAKQEQIPLDKFE